MSRALNIEPRVRGMINYLKDIEQGLLQIPSFQRDYVWKKRDILDLFDSIKRGYPIGSIILWKPEIIIGDNFPKIGSYYIPQGQFEYYILDGFQRLSSLFGCLTNPKSQLERDEKQLINDFNLYYDLDEERFFFPIKRSYPKPYQIPVYALVETVEFRQFARKELGKIADEEKINLYLERADAISKNILEYNIASIEIKNASIEEAVEIFSRVNSKGTEISKDWIVSALTNKDGFRLGTEIDNLLEELKVYNFNEIKRDVIFSCIQNSFGKVYFDTKIDDLARKSDFVEVTKRTIASIKRGVQFLFEELLVLNSNIIPYNTQLVYVTDFFNQIESPTEEQIKELKRWFWITSYSNYFTIYSLSNQRKAYYQFQKFLKGDTNNSVFNERPEVAFSVFEFPDKIFYGSVRAKSLLLFLLNHSNEFNRVDYSQIEGLDVEFLFYDFRDERGNHFPEMVVPVVRKKIDDFPKERDASFLLRDYTESFLDKYLLSPEMQQIYYQDPIDKQRIKDLRSKLIFDAEKDFVSKLGLNYDIDSEISE